MLRIAWPSLKNWRVFLILTIVLHFGFLSPIQAYELVPLAANSADVLAKLSEKRQIHETVCLVVPDTLKKKVYFAEQDVFPLGETTWQLIRETLESLFDTVQVKEKLTLPSEALTLSLEIDDFHFTFPTTPFGVYEAFIRYRITVHQKNKKQPITLSINGQGQATSRVLSGARTGEVLAKAASEAITEATAGLCQSVVNLFQTPSVLTKNAISLYQLAIADYAEKGDYESATTKIKVAIDIFSQDMDSPYRNYFLSSSLILDAALLFMQENYKKCASRIRQSLSVCPTCAPQPWIYSTQFRAFFAKEKETLNRAQKKNQSTHGKGKK